MILEAKNLGKRFGSFSALEDVSLTVGEGEVIGIVGESGAGKSTLLRALSSLEQTTYGEVLFLGKPFPFGQTKALQEVRREIGMIFQHFHLLSSRTALENVCLPLELRGEKGREKALELLKKVGLGHKADAYPSTLSGGEKQRVSIARALASSPKILFCDEATSALDPKTTREILLLLQKLNQELGLTLVLITHELSIVSQICHRVLILQGGRVVEQGDTLEVFSHPKHPFTRSLLQKSTHELDLAPLRKAQPDLLFLLLHFKGASAEKPLLSELISRFKVEVNILSGWIEEIRGTKVGTLTVALKGADVQEALSFFKANNVAFDILTEELS